MTKHRFGFFAKLAFVAVLLFLAISIVKKNLAINDWNNKIEEMQQELARSQSELDELNEFLSKEKSEETIKQVAREELNLRDKNTVTYKNAHPN